MPPTTLKVALDALTMKFLVAVGGHWDKDPLAPTLDTPLPHIVRKAIQLYLQECRRRLPELAQQMEEIERAERAAAHDSTAQTRRVVELARQPRGRPKKLPATGNRGLL